MQAGITDHVWDIEEFFETITSEPVPAPLIAQPLSHRKPITTSRELPTGRGFLRVVPTNITGTATAAPATKIVTAPVQLGLFDDDKEPS